MVRFEPDEDDPGATYALTERGPRSPMAEFLAGYDVIVQLRAARPDAPLTFLAEQDLGAFRRGSLVVDVSCDAGMGFSWARPTSFAEPMFEVGDGIHYYGVDHSPSYLWDSATWEVSEALLPFLHTVLLGPSAWEADETVRRAVEIRDGVVRNPARALLPGPRRACPPPPRLTARPARRSATGRRLPAGHPAHGHRGDAGQGRAGDGVSTAAMRSTPMPAIAAGEPPPPRSPPRPPRAPPPPPPCRPPSGPGSRWRTCVVHPARAVGVVAVLPVPGIEVVVPPSRAAPRSMEAKSPRSAAPSVRRHRGRGPRR
ncbi:MAG: hypothetical protein WKF76_08305 [Nocardioidaceae bacterium]